MGSLGAPVWTMLLACLLSALPIEPARAQGEDDEEDPRCQQALETCYWGISGPFYTALRRGEVKKWRYLFTIDCGTFFRPTPGNGVSVVSVHGEMFNLPVPPDTLREDSCDGTGAKFAYCSTALDGPLDMKTGAVMSGTVQLGTFRPVECEINERAGERKKRRRRQFGTKLDENASAVVVDWRNMMYVAGSSSGPFEGPNLGSDDIFIKPILEIGKDLPAWHIATTAQDIVTGLALDDRIPIISFDPPGLLAAGHSEGDLGGPNQGSFDIFVTKLCLIGDPSCVPGTPLWTQSFGSAEADLAFGIALDPLRNSYVVGQSYGPMNGETNHGGGDALVMKLSAGGRLLWTRLLGAAGDSIEAATAVATDNLGNAFVTGRASGPIGGSSAGGDDVFVARLWFWGGVAWIRQFGGERHDRGLGLTLDPDGNVLVSGTTEASLDGRNAGSFDAFLAKLDGDGRLLWTRQIGTAGEDRATDVVVDQDGTIHVAGFLGRTPSVADGAGEVASTTSEEGDAFVASYSPSGTLADIRRFGSPAADGAMALKVGRDGELAVVGWTRGDFADTLSAGGMDAFTAWLPLKPPISTNGSFEEPVIPGPWTRFNKIPGWSGPVDVHRVPDLPAHDGMQVVDLNQDGTGYIEQTFTTTSGARYTVGFWHGVNYHCVGSASFDVLIDGQVVQSFSSVATLARGGVEFVAATDRTTLRFQSRTGGCGAATIDDVTVTLAERE